MPSDKKQINARVTNDEYQALEELMEKLGLNLAETIRHCIVEQAKMNGIQISDTMPKRGTYIRHGYKKEWREVTVSNSRELKQLERTMKDDGWSYSKKIEVNQTTGEITATFDRGIE